MNLVVDMNLSPDWVPVLQRAGHFAVHWLPVGSPRAGALISVDENRSRVRLLPLQRGDR
jgi:predicted nuclease of predicted toxin-antitoxin system